jgi:CBS domain-containing protein
MFDQPIKNIMEQKKFLSAPPETTVSNAARLMAGKNVSAVMVVENGLLVGIFTERDAVFRVIAQGRDVKTTPLTDKSYGQALLLMQENGFRHVPVIENGRPIGIISSRNAMDPDLEEFVSEERRREHYR